jgi:hypothetical protein
MALGEAPLFCGNPSCELHVRAGEPNVQGAGNWATLSDGRVVGRGRYGDQILCDPCGRAFLLNLEPLSESPPSLEVAQEPLRARRRGGR